MRSICPECIRKSGRSCPTTWNEETNRFGGREWRNSRARLIDPLSMLGIHAPPTDEKSVAIMPYEAARDYTAFRGFTYIFNCRKHKG